MKIKLLKSLYLNLAIIGLIFTSCKQAQPVVTAEPAEEIATTTVEKIEEVIPFDPEVKKGVLSNGLTYYIRNNGKPEDKVELRLVVNVGSIVEDEDQLGLAHFMEHMNFNGTKNFEKNELVDYLQSIGVKFGAHLNAYTSFDETVYILPIPSDDPEKLEKGFQILEDWAHNALLTDEEIDNERGVVLEEFRLGQGADERMMQRYLPKVMYGSKYADRLPIGTKENLENFEYESLRRFYKDWYRPDLMAVMAVGDIDVATLEAKIKSHFGSIASPTEPRPREATDVPNHAETLIAIESDKEASFSQVRVLFKDSDTATPDTTVEDYRKSVLESLFAQMINNRLDELRNSSNPPFVYGYSFYGGTWARNKNAYQSFAMSSEDGQLRALKTLLEENERVRQHGFFKGELDRAKKDIIARLEKSFKDKDKMESGRIIGEYVQNYLEEEPMPGIAWQYAYYKDGLDEVDINEINGLIDNYLREDNRVIVLTGPEKDGLEKVTEEDITKLLNEVSNMTIAAYEDKVVASSMITELPNPGSITQEVMNEKLGTTTLTLSNGARLTYKVTDFKNDEILFDAFSYGGSSLYSTDDYKKIGFANGGLTEAGINGFDKVELGKMLSGKIVSVRPNIGTYSEGFSGSASPKDLEDLFQMTHLYFTALNKDKESFDSFVEKQNAFLANMMSNPQQYFSAEMNKFMYGKSPRFLGFPTPEKMNASDYDLAYEKYKERFADAGDFNFYFVGNIDEAKLKEYATKYIASLPTTNIKEEYKVTDFRPLTGTHKKVIEKGQDPKSSVRITYHGPTEYNEKENHALSSLGEILSIKLIEKLREEEGGVYGAGARGSISKMPYGWFRFNISFPCGPENVDALTKAAISEVEKLVEEGPTDKDLAKIKESQLLEYKEDLKENRYWLNTLRNADYQKKNAENIFEFEENVNALTKDYLQTVAKKYLTQGYILGIHNPETM